MALPGNPESAFFLFIFRHSPALFGDGEMDDPFFTGRPPDDARLFQRRDGPVEGSPAHPQLPRQRRHRRQEGGFLPVFQRKALVPQPAEQLLPGGGGGEEVDLPV